MRIAPAQQLLLLIRRRHCHCEQPPFFLLRRSNTTFAPTSIPHKQQSRLRRVMADYKDWSREDLLTRIAGLEALLGSSNGGLPRPQLQISRPAPTTASTSTSTAQAAGSEGPGLQTGGKDPKAVKGKLKKTKREFNVASQPCRKIALRFSYDGAHYSGLAAQNPSSYASSFTASIGATPLPTVEGVLWKALAQARLVDDAGGYEGAGWSRCGRTDRGVSAAGQVVALWVRSRRVDERKLREREEIIRRRKWESGTRNEEDEDQDDEGASAEPISGADAASLAMETAKALEEELGPRPSAILLDPEAEELPYVTALNRILPPTVRVHAWSPVRPDFSARFDCRYRHYKYFFTAGAPPSLRPPPSSSSSSSRTVAGGNNLGIGSGPRLDIAAMRDAARRLIGSHDFRNLCKVDSSKQVTNFIRRVDGVSIDVVPHGHWATASASGQQEEQDDGWSSEHMYVFNLRGTAFLYHQVRHIMAVLFLVGARLEAPSIVDELINVQSGRAARDRAAVEALRRTALDSSDDVALDELGRHSVRAWIDWCLPGSSATEPDGHTANTRPGGPRSDASIAAATANSDSDGASDALRVYETKPMYEMAADRPLVLWECGFRPVDVSWRAGTFDEPLGQEHVLPAPIRIEAPAPEVIEAQGAPEDAATEAERQKQKAARQQRYARKPTDDPNAPPEEGGAPDRGGTLAAWRTTADLHTSWTSSAISAQIARHFVLAAPSPLVGTLPAWTHFLDAAVPVQVQAEAVRKRQPTLAHIDSSAGGGGGSSVPIGNGLSRPQGTYLPLSKRKRGESVDVINARWVAGRGGRRAAVRGLTAEELSRGMKPRISAEEREQMREEEEGR
ncbi:hypothetical protein V8E36_007104 [Tilletia maclaganii]